MRINLTTEHKKELADYFCVDLELLEKRLTIVVLRKWERGLVEGLYQLREYQEDFNRDLSAFEGSIDHTESLGDRFAAFTGGCSSAGWVMLIECGKACWTLVAEQAARHPATSAFDAIFIKPTISFSLDNYIKVQFFQSMLQHFIVKIVRET